MLMTCSPPCRPRSVPACGGWPAPQGAAPVPNLGNRAERGSIIEPAHRPAAAANHGIDRLHIDAVHVGTLFAIDFDVDEVGVHLRRRRDVRFRRRDVRF